MMVVEVGNIHDVEDDDDDDDMNEELKVNLIHLFLLLM
jgi:hypothetical protein